MRLYDIAQEYLQILQLVECGELTAEAVKDTLEAINAEFDFKAKNCLMVVKQLQSDSDGIQKEIDRLKNLQKTADYGAERLIEYIKDGMIAIEKEKMDLGIFKLTLKAPTKAVEVLDESKIPSQYFRIIPESKDVDKTAIAAALKNNEVIHGVQLADGKRALLIK